MAATSSSEEVLAIRDLVDRGEYKEANARLDPLVEAGDQDAIGVLGLLHFFGTGRDKDKDKSYELCSQSAEHEQPIGLHCMGHIHSDGIRDLVEVDEQQAAYWWSKAIDVGDIGSMTHLAHNYYHGLGVGKDEKEGLRLLRKAAEAGDKLGLIQLGRMYGAGEMVEKDLGKKFEYWHAAVQSGLGVFYKNIQLWVGEEILVRFEDEQSRQEGLGIIRALAEDGYEEAWLRQGYFCLAGKYMPRDLDCAEQWYGKARTSNKPWIWLPGTLGAGMTELFDLVF